jgi:hypothetical protein
MKQTSKLLAGLGAGILWVSGLSLAQAADVHVDINVGSPDRVVVAPVQERVVIAPPPWAPAHGYRHRVPYYYYPEREVYYNTYDDVYFYRSGDRWIETDVLPYSLRVSLGEFVTVVLDGGDPRPYHRYVVSEYPRYYVVRHRDWDSHHRSDWDWDHDPHHGRKDSERYDHRRDNDRHDNDHHDNDRNDNNRRGDSYKNNDVKHDNAPGRSMKEAPKVVVPAPARRVESDRGGRVDVGKNNDSGMNNIDRRTGTGSGRGPGNDNGKGKDKDNGKDNGRGNGRGH